jgi:hypothetical protein
VLEVSGSVTTIAGKLANCLHILSSDKEGEVVAAARALRRTLRSAGTDIHALAEQIERPPNGRLSERDMQRLYDKGFNDRKRAAEDDRHSDSHNADGIPDWNDIGRFCQQRSNRLRENERGFVDE